MKYLDQIDAWVNGEMTEEERIAFQKEMEENPELEEEVRLFRDLIGGVEYLGLRETVQKVEADLEKELFFSDVEKSPPLVKKGSSQFVKYLLLLLLVLVLSGGLIWWMWPTSPVETDLEIPQEDSEALVPPIEAPAPVPDDPVAPVEPAGPPPIAAADIDAAYQKFFKTEASALVDILDNLEAMGLAANDGGRNKALAQALVLYEERQFEAAKMALLAYLKEQAEDMTARFYLGLTAMELEDYPLAQASLLPLSGEEAFELAVAAKWYLALTYSKQGQIKETIRLMQQIQRSSDETYAPNARDYLQLLKQ